MNRTGLIRTFLLLAALLLLALPTAGCGLFGGGYVRLRGSTEIHESWCPRLSRADRDGVVDADADDGPPCLECRREDALDWAND